MRSIRRLRACPLVGAREGGGTESSGDPSGANELASERDEGDLNSRGENSRGLAGPRNTELCDRRNWLAQGTESRRQGCAI
jgi:hypothetical protein